MSRIPCLLSAVALALAVGVGSARAEDRPFTPGLTCPALQALVLRRQTVIVATGPQSYELVLADSMACPHDETGVPAFEPSLDGPDCLAGWRCRQHNTDGTN